MSERNIETVREYNFDPKEVIAGLNGYYESDKRNGYITVKHNIDRLKGLINAMNEEVGDM